MAKSTFQLLFIIIGASIVVSTGSLALAETPEILIDLKFDKTHYDYGEPIGVTVSVMNKSGKNLLLSKGFSALDYYLEMRVIDPAGKLIIAQPHKPHREFPDAPPLARVLHDKEPIPVVPCEVLRAGSKRSVLSEDLRAHYALELPGKYSAQVQLSTMTFKDEPCSTKNYEWLGVLESETKYFYLEKEVKKSKSSNLQNLKHKFNHGDRKDHEIQLRRRLAENEEFVPSDSKDFNYPNKKWALEPLIWHPEQITPSRTKKPETELTRNIVDHMSLRRESPHQKIYSHYEFSSSASLFASNPASSPTKANPGGSGNPKPTPSAEMTAPAGATDVAVDSETQVDITGVGKNTVVIMNVLGQEVYNSLTPNPTAAYPYTQRIPIDMNATEFTLIYKDPSKHFLNCQQVDVIVKAYNENKPNKLYKFDFGFKTICLLTDDDDEDGIPNDVEQALGTNPEIKTLFVRPKQIQGFQFVYWNGFVALFPATKAGFADIPAFTQAGIEISVIGNPGNPYPLMRDFNYDPAQDSNHPPCDILDIIYMPNDAYCAYGHHNYGHTYFYSLGATWYWDTKGYVPNDQTSVHYQKYHYFTPLIYPFPLANYLSEGSYPRIEDTQRPVAISGCGLNQCYNFNYSSPLNLNASYPVTGRPDGTVEFNDIVFDPGTKEITYVGVQGTEYDHDAVLRRSIIHELGHALLAASEFDHCNDFQCILFYAVEDWEPWEFGPPPATGRSCTHSAGGSKDIRAQGVVHNSIH